MSAIGVYLPFRLAGAITQMATDLEMATLCARTKGGAILRLYRMDPPAVTIGRHQRWRSVIDQHQCDRRGWEWARRPTGGGALLHRCEVNYAVALSGDLIDEQGRASSRRVFELILRGLAHALELLGGRPSLNLGRSGRATGALHSAHGLCQQSLTRYEITVDGSKAVAAAQWHLPEAFLQHGTIYMQAPRSDDKFWPERPGGETLQSNNPSWWDVSRLVGQMNEAIPQISRAVRDGLVRTLDLDWRPVDDDWIDHDRIEERVQNWQKTGWNNRR